MEAIVIVENKDDALSQRDWAHMLNHINHYFRYIDDLSIRGIWYSSSDQVIQQAVWHLELLDNYEGWVVEVVDEFREQYLKSIRVLIS